VRTKGFGISAGYLPIKTRDFHVYKLCSENISFVRNSPWPLPNQLPLTKSRRLLNKTAVIKPEFLPSGGVPSSPTVCPTYFVLFWLLLRSWLKEGSRIAFLCVLLYVHFRQIGFHTVVAFSEDRTKQLEFEMAQHEAQRIPTLDKWHSFRFAFHLGCLCSVRFITRGPQLWPAGSALLIWLALSRCTYLFILLFI
jgi:hypothetical protein